jgi:hypothetical protein
MLAFLNGRFRRLFVVLFAVGFALSPVAAVDFSLEAGGQISTETPKLVSPMATAKALWAIEWFTLSAEMQMLDDGRFASPEPQFGGLYFLMQEAGLRFAYEGFNLEAGRFDPRDEFDSPYALFLSAQLHNPLTVGLSYDHGPFYFKTRWIGLNLNSALYKVEYPESGLVMPLDRGVSYKTYGFRFGDGFRFAYQESNVYTGRYFDLDFFLNPLPGYFVQYINLAAGTPWTQAKPWGEFDNSNFLVGFLLDYTKDQTWLGLQLLVDDINLNRIIAPDSYQNPDKIGLSLGWRQDLGDTLGRLGVYAALSTKYNYAPFSTNPRDWYGYTYYPASQFQNGDQWLPIALEDNYIGYQHGENNLALSVDYANKFEELSILGRMEYRISGSQSPSNAWHQLVNWTDGGQGTKFLDDERLEHRVRLWVDASYPLGDFTFIANAMIGFVVNELQLVAPGDDTAAMVERNVDKLMYLWTPSENTRFLAQLYLGVRYSFSL